MINYFRLECQHTSSGSRSFAVCLLQTHITRKNKNFYELVGCYGLTLVSMTCIYTVPCVSSDQGQLLLINVYCFLVRYSIFNLRSVAGANEKPLKDNVNSNIKFYFGETSRDDYTRGAEHLADYFGQTDDNHM